MKTIVLVGGGHGHLSVIKKIIKNNKNKFKIVLISNVPLQYYSGMASAYLHGELLLERMTLDLQSFCQKREVEFIEDDLEKIDKENNTLQLKKNGVLKYDLLSINIGATVKTYDLKLDDPSFPVKPIKNLEILVKYIEKMDLPLKEGFKIVVLGTGAGGMEVGLSVFDRLQACKIKSEIKFVGSHKDLLKGFPKKASQKLMAYRNDPSIHYLTDKKGLALKEENLILDSGETLNYDLLILATGASGHDYDFMEAFTLDSNRFISVDSSLKVESCDNIFALGDCITMEEEKLIRNGVFAIDQSKVLARNIVNYLNEKPLETYKQRKKYLAIIAMDKNRGLLTYGNLLMFGKWTLKLKAYIDNKYMKKLKK